LCVISLLSTFRKLFVTSSPRLRSAKTAATPPFEDVGGVAGGGGGAGAGGAAGGGGGGVPPGTGAEGALYSVAGIPYRSAIKKESVDSRSLSAHLRIPGQSSSMVLHDIFSQVLQDSDVRSDPFCVSHISGQQLE
jgi:hypothetical protein